MRLRENSCYGINTSSENRHVVLLLANGEPLGSHCGAKARLELMMEWVHVSSLCVLVVLFACRRRDAESPMEQFQVEFESR